ncbi:hypothetical protein [Aporhodopirellula aestuarii]|uniref:Uncharacterized protein n=1 Tax=Aporhodopirellula aestuarii TaxID=2950107 RepID=A0ABT0U8P7_9BACT|nr:hypothetical protein [Aporhodopirellula aestuarii]MCM2373263.1 hypothetical protein [Aporhodopirellula aestuarii]
MVGMLNHEIEETLVGMPIHEAENTTLAVIVREVEVTTLGMSVHVAGTTTPANTNRVVANTAHVGKVHAATNPVHAMAEAVAANATHVIPGHVAIILLVAKIRRKIADLVVPNTVPKNAAPATMIMEPVETDHKLASTPTVMAINMPNTLLNRMQTNKPPKQPLKVARETAIAKPGTVLVNANRVHARAALGMVDVVQTDHAPADLVEKAGLVERVDLAEKVAPAERVDPVTAKAAHVLVAPAWSSG